MTYVDLLATVTVTGATTLGVIVNGTATTVNKMNHVTAVPGDVVLISKLGAQWFAVGTWGTAPAPVVNQPAPDPKPVTTTGSLVVSPVETRSYRTTYGWRTDNTDVYHGQYGGWGNHTGSVFYGTKPRSLAGATVTSATIRVRRPSRTGSTYAAVATTMRLVTQATRPGGAPTLTSTTAGPSIKAGAETTFTIPTSWAQSMVDGTAGGLAFFDSDGSPYIIYAGRGTWSPAFTLTINWRRG